MQGGKAGETPASTTHTSTAAHLFDVGCHKIAGGHVIAAISVVPETTRKSGEREAMTKLERLVAPLRNPPKK